MSKIYSELITGITSFIGVYYTIQFLWEEAEKAQFGEYVVSRVDSFVCFVLSLIIVAGLTVWRNL